MRFVKLLTPTAGATGTALSALWTFPSILCSAFLVAWGAEAAQFLMSQGLALALLAWLQTLPEFAVEAVIAWEAGRDPQRAHLAIANLTGAIRLLLGLGWPTIYFVYALAQRARGGDTRFPVIRLQPEHSVEIVGLLPPLLYFLVIIYKGSFGWIDALVLLGLYAAYLAVLLRNPPHEAEKISEAPAVSRWAYHQTGGRRLAAIGGLFAVGGGMLYLTAHPFLESMLALAGLVGISQFFMVQWVAPFLSEFPEFVSTVSWARRVTHAPMALMNLVSSNINQWTVLAAMIPLVYGYSHWRATGVWTDFRFDAPQRLELELTLLQTALGMLLLFSMTFSWIEAALLLVLWLVQFAVHDARPAVAIAYGVWMVVVLLGFVVWGNPLWALRDFRATWKRDRPASRNASRPTGH